MRLAPDTIVAGDFRVLRALSGGGMGTVYVVEQLSTGRRRALKVMRSELLQDARLRERFQREALIGSRIDSEHVVEVVGAGIDELLRVPWIAMELLDGEDLAAHLASRGRLPPADARGIFAQVGHALAAAHAAGVVHRDLKPENIFLAVPKRADVARTIKLLDFGVAKLLSARVHFGESTTTDVVGTPLYMAPEQLAGRDVGPWTDVLALGLVAFRCLAGTSYWRSGRDESASVAQLFEEVRQGAQERASERAREVAPGVTLPEGFDDWFAKTADPDRRRRFATIETCVSELDAVLRRADQGDVCVPSVPRSSDEPVRGPFRVSRAVLLGAAGAVGLGAGLLFLVGLGARNHEPPTERVEPEEVTPGGKMVAPPLARGQAEHASSAEPRAAAVPDSSAGDHRARAASAAPDRTSGLKGATPATSSEFDAAVASSEAADNQDPWDEPVDSDRSARSPIAEASGFVTIACMPACERIIAGGVDLGPSPVIRAPLVPGLHVIRAERSGAETKVVTVKVVSGATIARRVSWE